MKDATAFWDGIAEKYAKSPIDNMEAYTYSLGRTRSYLTPGDKVLELGCGTGSTALILAENVDEYVASDLSGNMVAIGQRKAQEEGIENVRFVTASVDDPALDDGPYDVVLALNLLHLLPDIDAAMSRIRTLVKPGGLFISKTICPFDGPVPFKYRVMKLMLPLMQLVGKAPFVNFMTIRQLEGALTNGGFDIIETGNYPASPPSRYIVARRV